MGKRGAQAMIYHCPDCGNTELKYYETIDIYICVVCDTVSMKRNITKNEIYKIFNSKKELNAFRAKLTNRQAKDGTRKRNMITYWYGNKDIIKYWKAVGSKDWKTLKAMAKKDNNPESPASRILKIKNKL